MSDEHPVPELDLDPMIGRVLNERYRVTERLGEGGMGVVYLARHIVLDKAVALKILHTDYARREELVTRFLHEAKAASRIRHEHVVDVYDFGQLPEGNVFFAMELLDGRDLAAVVRQEGPFSFRRAKGVLLQVCAALQVAHEAGVIHRDLKPENVYLTPRRGEKDFVKILDFGIAKLTEIDEAGKRLTRTGMVFGTPEYMSPEQARGERVDARVDVYAAGCMLWEMLFGDVPFTGDNFMGILTKHLFDPIPRLPDRALRPDLPIGLQEVIDKALAKNRDERHASMRALAAALESLDVGRASSLAEEDDAPVGSVGAALAEARRPTDMVEGTLPPGPRRTKALFVAGAAAVVAIVGGFGIVMLGKKASPAPAGIAVPNPIVEQAPEPDRSTATPTATATTTTTTTPTATLVVPAVQPDAGIEERPKSRRRARADHKKPSEVKTEPVVDKSRPKKPVDEAKKPVQDGKLKELKEPFGD